MADRTFVESFKVVHAWVDLDGLHWQQTINPHTGLPEYFVVDGKGHTGCGAHVHEAHVDLMTELASATPVAGVIPGPELIMSRRVDDLHPDDLAHVRKYAATEDYQKGMLGPLWCTVCGGDPADAYQAELVVVSALALSSEGTMAEGEHSPWLLCRGCFEDGSPEIRIGRIIATLPTIPDAPRPLGYQGSTTTTEPTECDGGCGGRPPGQRTLIVTEMDLGVEPGHQLFLCDTCMAEAEFPYRVIGTLPR